MASIGETEGGATPRTAYTGKNKKHVEGQKGTPFIKCVSASHIAKPRSPAV